MGYRRGNRTAKFPYKCRCGRCSASLMEHSSHSPYRINFTLICYDLLAGQSVTHQGWSLLHSHPISVGVVHSVGAEPLMWLRIGRWPAGEHPAFSALHPDAGFVAGFLDAEGVFEVDSAPVDDRHQQDQCIDGFVADVSDPASWILRLSLELADGPVEFS